jgi:UDP-glucose 4-epimerase
MDHVRDDEVPPRTTQTERQAQEAYEPVRAPQLPQDGGVTPASAEPDRAQCGVDPLSADALHVNAAEIDWIAAGCGADADDVPARLDCGGGRTPGSRISRQLGRREEDEARHSLGQVYVQLPTGAQAPPRYDRRAMQLHEKRFLVTGGSGFVGSHVVDKLVDAGVAEVVVFDKVPRPENLAQASARGMVTTVEGDVTDVDSVRRALDGVDGVFHMAVLPLGPTVDQPRLGLEVNVVGTFNVFEAAQAAGVGKVVFSSASSVYGDTDETMDETHPFGARTMYGASKIAGEYFLRSFNDQFGLPYVTLRYMNVYGPRQEGGLVMAVARRVLAGKAPKITGDGSQSFDFVHVADVAGANIAAMASDVSAEEFNVGSGTEASAREIAEKLIEIVGTDVEVELDPSVRVLMKRRVGSNRKAKEQLGWEAEIGLDDGLRDTVEWIRANA